MNTLIVTIVTGLLSGGVVGAILTYLNGRTQASIQKAQTTADTAEKSYARLERENIRLAERVESLEQELARERKNSDEYRAHAVALQKKVDELEINFARSQVELGIIKTELAHMVERKEDGDNGASA
jgi:hypothetical protein